MLSRREEETLIEPKLSCEIEMLTGYTSQRQRETSLKLKPEERWSHAVLWSEPAAAAC